MSQVDVPVVGGHAGLTILPLFSQATPLKDLSAEERDALTKRTQDGGTEVVQAKAGKVGKQGPYSQCGSGWPDRALSGAGQGGLWDGRCRLSGALGLSRGGAGQYRQGGVCGVWAAGMQPVRCLSLHCGMCG